MGSVVFDGLNLVVRDMDASVAFYRLLGVDIPDGAVWSTGSGPHHLSHELPNGVDFDLDSPALARVYNAGWREPGEGGSRLVIGFRVTTREEVDERYAALVGAGHPGRQPPYDAFWGARYAIVSDPDGNDVGIMGPVDPARRGAPPSL